MRKKPLRIQFAGERWTIREERFDDELPEDADGICDYDKRLIIVRRGLPKERRHEVILHEVDHALHFGRKEHVVARLAEAQSRAWHRFERS